MGTMTETRQEDGVPRGGSDRPNRLPGTLRKKREPQRCGPLPDSPYQIQLSQLQLTSRSESYSPSPLMAAEASANA